VRLKSAISEDTARACFCEVLTGKRIQVANGAWFGDEAPGVLPRLWPFINDPPRRRARKVPWVVETAPGDRADLRYCRKIACASQFCRGYASKGLKIQGTALRRGSDNSAAQACGAPAPSIRDCITSAASCGFTQIGRGARRIGRRAVDTILIM
jgi:hypothetical protein